MIIAQPCHSREGGNLVIFIKLSFLLASRLRGNDNENGKIECDRHAEENIQNTAESIFAITCSLESMITDYFLFHSNEETIMDKEGCLGLLMALKQLSRPLI